MATTLAVKQRCNTSMEKRRPEKEQAEQRQFGQLKRSNRDLFVLIPGVLCAGCVKLCSTSRQTESPGVTRSERRGPRDKTASNVVQGEQLALVSIYYSSSDFFSLSDRQFVYKQTLDRKTQRQMPQCTPALRNYSIFNLFHSRGIIRLH
jgi:hypothetical protein